MYCCLYLANSYKVRVSENVWYLFDLCLQLWTVIMTIWLWVVLSSFFQVAQSCGVHNTVGIDLVAMSVNDVLSQGAEPLFFLDYVACGKLDTDVIKQVVTGVAQGCALADCALLGGKWCFSYVVEILTTFCNTFQIHIHFAIQITTKPLITITSQY